MKNETNSSSASRQGRANPDFAERIPQVILWSLKKAQEGALNESEHAQEVHAATGFFDINQSFNNRITMAENV
jgi:hypothetical protein